jgi:hypothetical protein
LLSSMTLLSANRGNQKIDELERKINVLLPKKS